MSAALCAGRGAFSAKTCDSTSHATKATSGRPRHARFSTAIVAPHVRWLIAQNKSRTVTGLPDFGKRPQCMTVDALPTRIWVSRKVTYGSARMAIVGTRVDTASSKAAGVGLALRVATETRVSSRSVSLTYMPRHFRTAGSVWMRSIVEAIASTASDAREGTNGRDGATRFSQACGADAALTSTSAERLKKWMRLQRRGAAGA